MNKSVYIVPLCLLAGACGHKVVDRATVNNTDNGVIMVLPQNNLGSRPMNAVLKATAFKMSGNYANNVAITLDALGNIVYYPAPTDISEASAPVEIGDGWWLNRQGIGRNSVFTKYTFEEYAALKAVPTHEQLKAAIIPGATVTAMIELPFAASEANAKLPEIKKFLLK